MDIPEANLFIGITIVLIIANAFFILAEVAITDSHKSQLEKMADDGSQKAQDALRIIDEPNIYLSAMQIGNVSCNILIGLFTGIAIAPVLTHFAGQIVPASFSGYVEVITLIFSTLIIILLCLIFSTTLPRKTALNAPEHYLLSALKPIMLWKKFLTPFINVFMGIANGLLMVLGINPHKDDSVTEDEVKDLIEKGMEDGTFEKAEQDIVDRIFHMSDQTAYSLMTPRTQMVWLDLEDSLEDNLKLILANNHTVFLVGKDDLDEFVGIVYAKDILDCLLKKEPVDLQKLMKKPMFVPRAMESFRLLEKFRETEVNEAIVLDEYGGVVGFITIFDIINEVLGDVAGVGSSDDDSPQMVQRDENTWLLDGLYDIDDFKEKFDIEKLPREESAHFKTMGGFLTSYFGYIPKEKEVRIWDKFRFEVVKMDKARIDKILLTQLK